MVGKALYSAIPWLIMAIVVFCVPAHYMIVYLLGPLDNAAKHRRCAVQFSLADFLAIFILLQVLLGCVHYVAGPAELRPSEIEITIDVLAAMLVAALWWTTIRTLSKAGIHKMRTRLLLLLVVIPLSYITAFAFPMPAIWLFVIVTSPAIPHWIAPPLAAQAILIIAGLVLRKSVLKALAMAEPTNRVEVVPDLET